MSVILSKHGSVRGMEGGVGKAVESFREKTKKLTVSPLLQRIQEVGNDPVLQTESLSNIGEAQHSYRLRVKHVGNYMAKSIIIWVKICQCHA